MASGRDDILAALAFEGTERWVAPVHPGAILKTAFLEPMGITQSKLAADLGVSFRRMHEIVNGKRSISAETALLLARYFGISPRFWLGLQSDYELRCAMAALPYASVSVTPCDRLSIEQSA